MADVHPNASPNSPRLRGPAPGGIAEARPPRPPVLPEPRRMGAAGHLTHPARDAAKRAANRHSRLVTLAKIGVPVLGVLIAGAFLARTFAFSFVPGLNMPAVLFSKDGLTMVEPRLTGRSRDRAYDIGASRAMQDFASPKVVKLEDLDGRIEMNDKGWAKVNSKTGVYDGAIDQLVVDGNVTVVTSNGYSLTAQEATINLVKGELKTVHPVHIEGPTGVLDAQAAQVTENGKNLLFTGGVKVTIHPTALPAQPLEPTAPAPEGEGPK